MDGLWNWKGIVHYQIWIGIFAFGQTAKTNESLQIKPMVTIVYLLSKMGAHMKVIGLLLFDCIVNIVVLSYRKGNLLCHPLYIVHNLGPHRSFYRLPFSSPILCI